MWLLISLIQNELIIALKLSYDNERWDKSIALKSAGVWVSCCIELIIKLKGSVIVCLVSNRQKQTWITRDKTGICSGERPLEYLASDFPAFHDRATCFDNLTSAAVSHLHPTTTHTARRCTSISLVVTHKHLCDTIARYDNVIIQNYNLLFQRLHWKDYFDWLAWELF